MTQDLLFPPAPEPEPDVKDILAKMAARMDALENQNSVLRAELAEKQLEELPGHLRQSGSDMSYFGSRAARSVTIITAPVADDPTNPMWGKHIVDPGSVVQNSKSHPMRDDG